MFTVKVHLHEGAQVLGHTFLSINRENIILQKMVLHFYILTVNYKEKTKKESGNTHKNNILLPVLDQKYFAVTIPQAFSKARTHAASFKVRRLPLYPRHFLFTCGCYILLPVMDHKYFAERVKTSHSARFEPMLPV